MTIRPLEPANYPDFVELMSTNDSARACQCMWWMLRVSDFHANGEVGNAVAFRELLQRSAQPMGLLAYDGVKAVGWCAVGPRQRYTRAITTPSFRGRDKNEDASAWLIPCLFVRDSHRGQGVTGALLACAVEFATAQGSSALEGFPFQNGRRKSGDVQVGSQEAFEAAGFRVVRVTSPARVVMRRDLVQ